MSKIDVTIVTLDPMRMIGANGFGEEPEGIAWEKVANWLKDSGRLEDGDSLRFFGYNNPNPAPGSTNYGYDQWVVVDADAEPGEGMLALDFPGGLYAKASCTGPQNLFPLWQQLIQWRENSAYKPATHQWIEECRNGMMLVQGAVSGTPVDYDTMQFDLYLPIAS